MSKNVCDWLNVELTFRFAVANCNGLGDDLFKLGFYIAPLFAATNGIAGLAEASIEVCSGGRP